MSISLFCFLVLAEWENKLVSLFRYCCLLHFQPSRVSLHGNTRGVAETHCEERRVRWTSHPHKSNEAGKEGLGEREREMIFQQHLRLIHQIGWLVVLITLLLLHSWWKISAKCSDRKNINYWVSIQSNIKSTYFNFISVVTITWHSPHPQQPHIRGFPDMVLIHAQLLWRWVAPVLTLIRNNTSLQKLQPCHWFCVILSPVQINRISNCLTKMMEQAGNYSCLMYCRRDHSDQAVTVLVSAVLFTQFLLISSYCPWADFAATGMNSSIYTLVDRKKIQGHRHLHNPSSNLKRVLQ